jgi:hypothetical protein
MSGLVVFLSRFVEGFAKKTVVEVERGHHWMAATRILKRSQCADVRPDRRSTALLVGTRKEKAALTLKSQHGLS